MITFVITKEDITNRFECSMEDSILSLKKLIIERFNLKAKYVDIDFILEKPIRSMGKFNLESGVIPRSLDAYKFNRYGLDGREINATFQEVNDYEPKKYERSFKHINLSQKYKQPSDEGSTAETPKFDISSESDFPSLG